MSADRAPSPPASLEAARDRMLRQLRAHVRDTTVIDAIAGVRREEFVPPRLRAAAYDDRALPIGEGQTISQPLIVALMLEALHLRESDHVLDIGTGSGYVAAVLARLVRTVITVERVEPLCVTARSQFERLGLRNVEAHRAGDLLGWPAREPYDAILVSAAAPHLPRILLDQLAEGGRIVIPVGPAREQQLVRAEKTSHGVALDRHGACMFVPLIGAGAWA